MKLLVTGSTGAIENATKFSNRTIITPERVVETDFSNVDSVLVDGYNQEVLEYIPESVAEIIYTDEAIDFDEDISTLRKFLKLHKKTYTKTAISVIPNPEDGYIENVSNTSVAVIPTFDSDHSEALPVDEQIKILEPLLNGKKIGAGSIAELTAQLTSLSYDNSLFLRDRVTGLYKSAFARRSLISEYIAQTIFETHFVDKLSIKRISYKTDKETGEVNKEVSYKSVSRADIELLWKNLKLNCTFNSRKQLYDSIAEWDGVPRMATFMKQYYECDANPNFFLLLMTSIIGKIVSPENNYCPYFFDIVSSCKGIGKSLLCRRLLGNKYVAFLSMTSRRDDFFVNAYDGNNILVVDDECTWCGKGFDKLTMDGFKTLVTNSVDIFSRKFQQPESHARCFIIIRTSNEVNQVYSTNERRQIIFKCNLRERECRILNLPDSFFEQMLAEAKAYYEANGVYKLSDSDWEDVKESNKENYNWEKPENFILLDYIDAVRKEPKIWGVEPVAKKFSGYKWGNYRKYCSWMQDQKKDKYNLDERKFWRVIAGLNELGVHGVTVLSETKYDLVNGGHCRLFRVDPLPLLDCVEVESNERNDDDDDIPL